MWKMELVAGGEAGMSHWRGVAEKDIRSRWCSSSVLAGSQAAVWTLSNTGAAATCFTLTG